MNISGKLKIEGKRDVGVQARSSGSKRNKKRRGDFDYSSNEKNANKGFTHCNKSTCAKRWITKENVKQSQSEISIGLSCTCGDEKE